RFGKDLEVRALPRDGEVGDEGAGPMVAHEVQGDRPDARRSPRVEVRAVDVAVGDACVDEGLDCGAPLIAGEAPDRDRARVTVALIAPEVEVGLEPRGE